ncbi:MAG: ArnT family glycosyltransferase [Thermoanaerobaculia bacterium]
MWLTLTMVAALVTGWELMHRWWLPDEPNPLDLSERLLYAAVLGVTLWQASIWALALCHALTRNALIVRTAIFVIAAIVLMGRRLSRERDRWNVDLTRDAVVALLPYVPIALWVQFAAWRGMVAPPANIDGLSYHLPKAVMLMRAGAFDALRNMRFLISWRPSNYELLLADGMLLGRTDAVTEWISVLFYVCFIIAAVALGQRWWGRNPAAAAVTALLAGSIPVVLLHSSTYKNDVMVAFLMTAALVTLGRWLSDSDPRALLLTIVVVAAAAGTKKPAALFAVMVLVILIWSIIVRRQSWNRRSAAVLGLVAISAFVLLGGGDYIVKLTDRFYPVVNPPPSAVTSTSVTYNHYGNLWKGLYVLVAESFSADPNAVKFPWAAGPWAWRRYELYYSELGIPFSIGAIVLLFFFWRLRGPHDREQMLATVITLLAFLPLLPFDGPPVGRHLIAMPRFAMALAVVVLAWVIGPLAAFASRHRFGSAAIISIAAACFVIYAVKSAVNDTFVPLSYLVTARERAGTRLPPIGYRRAAAVVDEMAGPNDRIAFDGGSSSLLHLAYGAGLQRPVDVIPPGPGRPVIDRRVKWVAIDRSWNMIWGNAQFTDISDAQKFLLRGQATEEDLRVYRALAADPDFELVFSWPEAMQMVFRRRR